VNWHKHSSRLSAAIDKYAVAALSVPQDFAKAPAYISDIHFSHQAS
jgi:hypothetical protein